MTINLIGKKRTIKNFTNLSKHMKAGHQQTTGETPFQWRFAAGPIVARGGLLAGRKCQVSSQQFIFKHAKVHRKTNW